VSRQYTLEPALLPWLTSHNSGLRQERSRVFPTDNPGSSFETPSWNPLRTLDPDLQRRKLPYAIWAAKLCGDESGRGWPVQVSHAGLELFLDLLPGASCLDSHVLRYLATSGPKSQIDHGSHLINGTAKALEAEHPAHLPRDT
jgi:hypothetical protein